MAVNGAIEQSWLSNTRPLPLISPDAATESVIDEAPQPGCTTLPISRSPEMLNSAVTTPGASAMPLVDRPPP